MLASQYQGNGEPKEAFTLSLKELTDSKGSLTKYFAFVKQSMSNLYSKDEKRAKDVQLRAQRFVIPGAPGPPGPRSGPPPLQQSHMLAQARVPSQPQPQAQPQQLQVPPPQLSANVLSASNLQKQTDMLALERSRSLQSNKAQLNVAGHVQPPGSMSPDGSPPIHIKSSIGPEDLKLPIRKKRMREPESEIPKVKESPKPVHRCTQPNCEFGVKGFETKTELEDHHKWHETERRRQEEEEEKNRRKVADPLAYFLSSTREGLGLDDEGKPKGKWEEAMKEETPSKTGVTPQIKSGTTPLLGTTPLNKAGLTPAPGRSPALFKPPQLSNVKTPSGKPTPGVKTMPKEEHANEQLPTPPSSSAWEGSSMSPDVLRQCFDGLRENVSGLSNLNPAIFTPAYTPGASELEVGEGGENVNGSFEDWNPFGYKDSLTEDMMQEIEWDSDSPNLFGNAGLGGGGWALAHGFELRT